MRKWLIAGTLAIGLPALALGAYPSNTPGTTTLDGVWQALTDIAKAVSGSGVNDGAAQLRVNLRNSAGQEVAVVTRPPFAPLQPYQYTLARWSPACSCFQ